MICRPSRLVRLVALSDRLIILGLNAAANQLSAARWIATSDEVVTQLATGLFSGGTITIYAACKVLMEEPPAWLPELPLKVEGGVSERYEK